MLCYYCSDFAGAYELMEDEAIVQRLSAIEELAGMDVLCSDKTGTLTIGVMTVSKENTYADFKRRV